MLITGGGLVQPVNSQTQNIFKEQFPLFICIKTAQNIDVVYEHHVFYRDFPFQHFSHLYIPQFARRTLELLVRITT